MRASFFAIGLTLVALVVFAAVATNWFMELGENDVIVFERENPLGPPRVIREIDASISDVPEVVRALSQSNSKVAYATFAFRPPDKDEVDDTLNIQFSPENGTMGFDWILLGPANIKDRERFVAYAESKGSVPELRAMNGVQYLRVEGVDLVEFGMQVMTELYGLPPDSEVSLYHEGFDWPHNNHR